MVAESVELVNPASKTDRIANRFSISAESFIITAVGQQNVAKLGAVELRRFMRQLLEDVRVLDEMLERGLIETGNHRIGCEQEMFLTDQAWTPVPVATEVLSDLSDNHYTTELARFNLELNLDPVAFGGDCLSRMEAELRERLTAVRRAARISGAGIVLAGILPTLRKSDLSLDNMTPKPRYKALNDAIAELRGGDCELRLDGADELMLRHESIMLESACTSFQIHYQADPGAFPRIYNTAQAITAPLLAAAANSPLLFGRRLWAETRIPLFQQAVDTRHAASSLRERVPRVSFGQRWVQSSVTELFKEDIARFPVLLGVSPVEDSRVALRTGAVPRLEALQAYNSTVYRWNRACYGLTNGEPHLRIENRVLPSGPSILDEVANAAFFFGMLRALSGAVDVASLLDFDDVHANFIVAAREGLAATFRWMHGTSVSAQDLILRELLPMAREGLKSARIRSSDVDRYLQVIEGRVQSRKTGAQWMIQSLANLKRMRRDRALATLTAAMARRQESEAPVHEWPMAELEEGRSMKHDNLRIEESMTTDLFTIRPEEPVDLVANLMDWKHIRHLPVEDQDGRLLGLVSNYEILKYFNQRPAEDQKEPASVRSIMNPAPLTAAPETPVREAISLMVRNKTDYLLIVKDERLAGIVTERDILHMAADLLA